MKKSFIFLQLMDIQNKFVSFKKFIKHLGIGRFSASSESAPEIGGKRQSTGFIGSLGRVHLGTGECDHFNIFDTYDGTAEVWTNENGNPRLVFTSGDKPLAKLKDYREFRNDQTQQRIEVDFVRGIEPKQALGIGFGPKIKTWMSRSEEFDYNDFFDVWQWALAKWKFIVFPYLVSLNGQKWVNGEKIDVSDSNNELLWRSVEAKNIAAVKALLTVPGLFNEEILTMDQGTSELKNEFIYRGHTKSPARATNFGTFVNLAIEHYPNKEIENLLLNYYRNELSKR
jgi:hypothetical protein